MSEKANIEKRIKLAESEYDAIMAVLKIATTEAADVVISGVESMDNEEGRLTKTTRNFGGVEKIIGGFRKWLARLQKKLMKRLVAGIGKIINLNDDNYQSQFKVAETAREQARKQAVLSWGWDGENVVAGSYLENLFQGGNLALKVGQAVNRAVATGMSLKDFRANFRAVFVGANGYLNRHFQTATFDLFQRADRIANKVYADELGLKHALYSGTIIKTTRPFCKARVNKVFTMTEIEGWKKLDFAGKPAFNYDPFTDCGGYNCRHHLSFISPELAAEITKE